MRKLFLTALVTIGMIGSSVAQMAIPGEIFADNPSRFNGRKVTIKNIQLDGTQTMGGSKGVIAPAPLGGSVSAAPGPIGTPSAPNVHPCRAPRGFSEIQVVFKGKPEFKGCFFMADNMRTQLFRELGGQLIDAQITFRGDSRTGYAVTFYRLGM
jgi:hypothetical protein